MTEGQRPEPAANSGSRREYWRANLRLIAILLTVWAVVSLVFGILLIEQLNNFKIGRLPLGFWFAQQGSIYLAAPEKLSTRRQNK